MGDLHNRLIPSLLQCVPRLMIERFWRLTSVELGTIAVPARARLLTRVVLHKKEPPRRAAQQAQLLRQTIPLTSGAGRQRGRVCQNRTA